MIRYTLICDQDHRFDSWFASSAAYDGLERAGHLACAVCGSGAVTRTLMAPAVPAKSNTKDAGAGPPDDRPAMPEHAAPQNTAPQHPAPQASSPHASGDAALSAPLSEAETALAKLRQEVETNSDYVGMSFAAEARKMHDGDAPERAIYGEAKLDDAKKLIEDGIPVAPLPFMPKRKTN